LEPSDHPFGCSDPFERNDGYTSAVPLEDAVGSEVLDFCPGADTDFYVVELFADEVLRVGAELEDGGEGSISMRLTTTGAVLRWWNERLRHPSSSIAPLRRVSTLY